MNRQNLEEKGVNYDFFPRKTSLADPSHKNNK